MSAVIRHVTELGVAIVSFVDDPFKHDAKTLTNSCHIEFFIQESERLHSQ